MPNTSVNAIPRILVIVGPTCSGKTAVSLGLANRLDGEIISADSRQVYKHLDIGTAKPSLTARRTINHYFVDELLPDQRFSAGEFGEKGRDVVQRILARHKTPIVVGGSGLYIRSLIDGLFEGPGADEEFREAMEHQLREGRLGDLLDELRRVDPVSASTIDPTKPRRVIRALEVHRLTGVPLSTLHREKKVTIGFHPVVFGLEWRREELYRRIEARCEHMIDAGLLEEVERLESIGYDDTLGTLQTVGYAEAFAYRRGEVSYQEFVRLFKQNSRRYAKRQQTWFRKDGRVRRIEMTESRGTTEVVDEVCRRFLELDVVR